jgi:ESCRT-II complex subunit VPS36
MHAGLQDLEALMTKAKEMVELASSLNAKLTAQEEEQARRRALYPDLAFASSTVTEPEEATFIRSSLAQLGLPTMAVTQDMVKDEDQYHEELARELASVLSGKGTNRKGLLGTGEGIIGLDEVWGGWNRARGVGEIFSPPEQLIQR